MTDIQKENKSGGKVPNLRFPSFEGEWEVKKLGEIAEKIGDGLHGTPSYTDESNYYFINGNNLINGKIEITENTKKIDAKTFLKNDKNLRKNTLLISINGTIGNIAKYNNENVMLGKSVGYFNFEENSDFLYFVLQTSPVQEHFKSELTGSTIKNLSLKTLRETNLRLPSQDEQQKVASFLSLIDERITTQSKILEQLETLIKNVSEKIFSQNIKFKKFEKKWEVKTLGEILIEINERTINSNQYRVLSSTAKGLFYQSDYFKKEVASKDNAGYKILKINQLVFSPQNLWLGNINVNTTYEIGIVSPSYKVFSFNEKAIVSYCKYFLKSSKMMFEYEQCSEQGASIVRRNLNMDLFLNIPILLPKLEEQIQISSFLTKIDQKIQTEKAILEQLEIQKKYLLQQMFV